MGVQMTGELCANCTHDRLWHWDGGKCADACECAAFVATAGSVGPVTAQPDQSPDISRMIEDYEEARAAYDLAMSDMERARAEVLAQVQDRLDAIAAEFGPMLAAASESMTP